MTWSSIWRQQKLGPSLTLSRKRAAYPSAEVLSLSPFSLSLSIYPSVYMTLFFGGNAAVGFLYTTSAPFSLRKCCLPVCWKQADRCLCVFDRVASGKASFPATSAGIVAYFCEPGISISPSAGAEPRGMRQYTGETEKYRFTGEISFSKITGGTARSRLW